MGAGCKGNPRSPSPRLSVAGDGGLAFGCGGAQWCAVSSDYAIYLVSPAATMDSLGSLFGEDEDLPEACPS